MHRAWALVSRTEAKGKLRESGLEAKRDHCAKWYLPWLDWMRKYMKQWFMRWWWEHVMKSTSDSIQTTHHGWHRTLNSCWGTVTQFSSLVTLNCRVQLGPTWKEASRRQSSHRQKIQGWLINGDPRWVWQDVQHFKNYNSSKYFEVNVAETDSAPPSSIH